MHNTQVGTPAYFTIHHLELYGEPKTDIHGVIVGYSEDKVLLEVPIYGVFSVSPDHLKGEEDG